jgi:hypothetical protein
MTNLPCEVPCHGKRNLYLGSAAMLMTIGALGYGKLRRPKPAKAEAASGG